MMAPLEELETLCDDIQALGKQIQAKRERALEIAKGRVGTTREGSRFVVDYTSVRGPYWRLFVVGPALKKDGTPHARVQISNPVTSLVHLGERQEVPNGTPA